MASTDTEQRAAVREILMNAIKDIKLFGMSSLKVISTMISRVSNNQQELTLTSSVIFKLLKHHIFF